MNRDRRLAELRNVNETVSRETFEVLEHFEALFMRWNARINLASQSTLKDFWFRHIVDSTQIVPLGKNAARWLDLGSGGGLPGVVIAILLRDFPGSTITMIESNAKKAAFLRTAIRETSAHGQVICSRIEDVRLDHMPQVVTARALAPLGSLLSLAEPWLSAGAVGLFHKGRDYRREIEESHDEWRFDLVQHQSLVDPESAILEIRNPQRKEV